MTINDKDSIDMFRDGFTNVKAGEGKVFEGHAEIAAAIGRIYERAKGSTKAVRSDIVNIFDRHEKSEIHNECGKLLLGVPGNRDSQTAASNLRQAYVWMYEKPAQVQWVRDNHPDAIAPRSMREAWKKHQTATIRREVDDGASLKAIASALGVPEKDIKEAVEKAKKAKNAKVQKEAEKAEQTTASYDAYIAIPPEDLADGLIERDRDYAEALLDRLKAALAGEVIINAPALADLDPLPIPANCAAITKSGGPCKMKRGHGEGGAFCKKHA